MTFPAYQVPDPPPGLESVHTLISRALEAISNQQFSDAVSLFNTLTASFPSQPDLWVQLGLSYEGAGLLAPAEEAMNRAISLKSDNIPSLLAINRFRVKHSEHLTTDRPRFLVGGGAAANRGQSYWSWSFMRLGDVFVYGVADLIESVDWYIAGPDFQQILAELPQGWIPDWVIHFTPEYNRIPNGIDESPYPTAVLIQDIRQPGNHLLRLLPRFDRVGLFDTGNLPLFNALSGGRTVYTPGNGLNVFNIRPEAGEDLYDVVFLGNLDASRTDSSYTARDQLAKKLISLRSRYKVLVSSNLGDGGEHGKNYLHALNSTKIGICHTMVQKIHPSLCEIMGCGKLAFVNVENREALSAFQDKVDLVAYTEETLESLLDYYLAHPEERERIASNGREKIISSFSLPDQLTRAVETLNRSLRSDPRNLRVHSSDSARFLLDRGMTNFYTHAIDLAYQDFSAVIDRFGTTYPEAYNNRGVILWLQRKPLEATKQLTQATLLKPNYLPPLLNLYALNVFSGAKIDKQPYNIIHALIEKKDEWTLEDFPIYLSPERLSAVAERQVPVPGRFHELYCRATSDWANEVPSSSEKLKQFFLGYLAYLRYLELKLEKTASMPLLREASELFQNDPELLLELADRYRQSGQTNEAKAALVKALDERPLFAAALAMLREIEG